MKNLSIKMFFEVELQLFQSYLCVLKAAFLQYYSLSLHFKQFIYMYVLNTIGNAVIGSIIIGNEIFGNYVIIDNLGRCNVQLVSVMESLFFISS